MGADEFVTRQEIISQPETWRKTLSSLASGAQSGFPRIKDYDRILCIGCGSTHYLSMWAARALQSSAHLDCRALPSSEFLFRPQAYQLGNQKTLLVAISRSGHTSETVQAVEAFKSRNAGESVAITCYPGSDLARLVDYQIAVPAGQEESVAQTRAFTNMMLGFATLVHGAPRSELISKLDEGGRSLLDSYSSVATGLGRDLKIQRFFFLGSHSQYGLASEAMLKMKEMSLSYSEAYHFMEFRHGPMSMVNDESLVLGLISKETADYEFSVLHDMKALGARIVVVAPEGVTPKAGVADHLIQFPVLDGVWSHVFYLPILQLLAFERSVFKGLNPDRPKNLEAVVVLE